MTHFINVRGCNGSGKTTLLRSIAKTGHSRRDVVRIKDGEKFKTVCITVLGHVAVVGDYIDNTCTTAGLDRISTQAGAKDAIKLAAGIEGVYTVLFEGVVVSTIYGPWAEWAATAGGTMTWAFLDTPLAICLARIQERNGGKPVKEDQVADKHRTILRVRDKALAANLPVADIHWQTALKDLKRIINP